MRVFSLVNQFSKTDQMALLTCSVDLFRMVEYKLCSGLHLRRPLLKNYRLESGHIESSSPANVC